MKSIPTVLLSDINEFWCELSQLYWSQQTLSLISRHPLSSAEEILVLFCPQCLTRYSDDEASATNGCCASCQECPICCCILTRDNSLNLTCGSCTWQGSEVDTNQVSAPVESACFNIILQNLSQSVNQSGKRSSEPPNSRSRDSIWQMEQLNQKLSKNVAAEDLQDNGVVNNLKAMSSATASTNAVCAPSRVKLLSKRSLRSRQDNRTGRMNILMQPKTLPLEGDSSLKVQRGKWWVKDSSAVHELPFVSLLVLPTAAQLHDPLHLCELQLSLTNPKMTEVTITFTAESADEAVPSGEFLWMDKLGASRVAQCRNRLAHSMLMTRESSASAAAGSTHTSAQVLSLVLGCYEDELLKDTSAGPTGAAGVVEGEGGRAGEDCVDALERADASLHERPWKHSVTHNKAVVTIPVGLQSAAADGGAAVGSSDSAYASEFVLELCCTVDLGGGSIVSYPFKVIF